LIEFGPAKLDLNLRFRAHALMQRVERLANPAITEVTPGIRSLQIQFDPARLPFATLLEEVRHQVAQLPDVSQIEVATRVVRLPLSWDDEATRLAIKKYTELVRKDAPWAPSNIEFIRRINGLDGIEDVKKIVFDPSYLVLGLGDVYLGAPVATPLDPRHRLVTTKYNPARTWTPENAVGIGGAYLCVYGMEGPGGYQFVGRTLQMFNRFRVTKDFETGKPWLLRFFDQLRFYPVSGSELLEMRRAFAAGRLELETSEHIFRLGEYNQFLAEHTDAIQAFKARQQAAFEAERKRWADAGSETPNATSQAGSGETAEAPPNSDPLLAPVPGSVWKRVKQAGDSVQAGETVIVLESMKMEIAVESPVTGTLLELRCQEGQSVTPGETLGYVLELR
jgi:urea carboxylase